MGCDNKPIWEQIQEILRLPSILKAKGFFQPAVILPTSGHTSDRIENDPNKDAEKFGKPKFMDLVDPGEENSVWDDLVKHIERKNSIENSNNITKKT